MILPLFGLPQGSEMLVIAVVVLILFGARKIPEFMKGIGKGVKSFKDGLKDVQDDISSDVKNNSKKLDTE